MLRRRIRRHRMAAVALTLALAAGGDAWILAARPLAASVELAAKLIAEREFNEAASILREVVFANPSNREAREMLAYALESAGDREGERQVRAALARDFPDNARVHSDYGRVLERSGADSEALVEYRRARELTPEKSDPELDAAIDRMEGRTSVEVAIPADTFTDPDATAYRLQTGAAVPLKSGWQLSFVAARLSAHATADLGDTVSDELGGSLVLRRPSGAWMTVGPRAQRVSTPDGRGDSGLGGIAAGGGPLGKWFEADASVEYRTPWDEAAVTVLHGGQVSSAVGHLYAHLLDRRLLLQVGRLERRLSVLPADPASADRPEASQSMLISGFDVVVWRQPRSAVRGEMLNHALTSPAPLSPAVTLGYRHYDVTTDSSPEFAAILGLVPRNSVDELSTIMTAALPGRRVGMELRGGYGRDTERDARLWRAGGAFVWAPAPSVRFELGYEQATDLTTGFVGERHGAHVSCHVDF
jgi:hypothetical protein